MDKQSAINLIRETFENPFDKERYIKFIKNLFNNITIDYREYYGRYIPDSFKPYINKYERIGKYTVEDKRIDILIVYLNKGTSIERARTTQRNFVAGYLTGKYGSDKEKDAAVVAFVSPELNDWRFSLVKMEYKLTQTKTGRPKGEEEFTPARRWSFLVGSNEASHTAQSRLVNILADDEHNPTFQQLEEAFSIEKVTKEFINKYRDLYLELKNSIDKVVENDKAIKEEFENKKVNTVDFSKKLLGQIVFLYFLQKKGWLGVPNDKNWGEGNRNFMRSLFTKCSQEKKNFFNDYLEFLFYDTLNNPRTDQADTAYSKYFDCRIPFLNGGLFEPINNYDWKHTDIIIPNELFSNSKKTDEGDIGSGILDVFDRYNFTVQEDEPLEKEVALDPELLGKVFENLIEENTRKGHGAYYTPREIVHYMCQESLINYLSTELNAVDDELSNDTTNVQQNQVSNTVENKITKTDIEIFIKHGEHLIENEKTALQKEEDIKSGKQKSTSIKSKMPESIKNNAEPLDEKLANIRVCDPAIGSGAFPVGMMLEIVKARNVLTNYFSEIEERTPYNFKWHCIENCLYGVDIDSSAIDIAKLRFWLSLIVDEEDITKIKPLPNLDYKLVCGNSLLSVEIELFNGELFNQLEKLKPKYFNETDINKKNELKKQINELIKEITNNDQYFDFKVYFSEVFHEKKGFDVVIGNPPYIQLQKAFNSKIKYADLYKNVGYGIFDRTSDIYCLFYEEGIKLLKNNGILCYISSNKWMRAKYGKKLRTFFMKYNPLFLIDLGPGIFENATVDTCIMMLKKTKNNVEYSLRAVTIQKDKNQPINIDQQVKEKAITLSNLSKDTWFIADDAEQKLKEKIERIGKPLKEWDVKIYYGIKTGLNEAFIIDSAKRQDILDNCKDEAERERTEKIIKPILRGKDIKRYYYEWAGLWVIGIFPTLKLNINDYPAIKKYFLDHFDIRQLEQSGEKYPKSGFNARKKTGNKWFETQDQIAYYKEFEKEKIVWAETDQALNTVIVSKNFYLQKTCFMIIPKNENNHKIINALLNSKISQWYIRHQSSILGISGMSLTKDSVKKIPLPPITPTIEPIVHQIESLVDQILSAKKENPQADTSNLEKEIDRLVYQLYDLTEEEIKIVERKG